MGLDTITALVGSLVLFAQGVGADDIQARVQAAARVVPGPFQLFHATDAGALADADLHCQLERTRDRKRYRQCSWRQVFADAAITSKSTRRYRSTRTRRKSGPGSWAYAICSTERTLRP